MKINDDLERDILSTLFKHGSIGKHYTPIINLCKNLNHYSCDEIKKGIISLRKKKFIDIYKTYNGIDVRIIPSNIQEIKRIIEIEY